MHVVSSRISHWPVSSSKIIEGNQLIKSWFCPMRVYCASYQLLRWQRHGLVLPPVGNWRKGGELQCQEDYGMIKVVDLKILVHLFSLPFFLLFFLMLRTWLLLDLILNLVHKKLADETIFWNQPPCRRSNPPSIAAVHTFPTGGRH